MRFRQQDSEHYKAVDAASPETALPLGTEGVITLGTDGQCQVTITAPPTVTAWTATLYWAHQRGGDLGANRITIEGAGGTDHRKIYDLPAARHVALRITAATGTSTVYRWLAVR